LGYALPVENEAPKAQIISIVPLEARKPPSGQWALVVLLAFIAAGIACGAWVVYEVASERRNPASDSTLGDFEEPSHTAEKEASLAQFKKISEALFRYRDQMGGGVRFPDQLADLTEIEILPRGYDFRGPLSGKPVVYRPEMPPSQDPALWVLAHDRLYGRRANPRGYGYSQGLIGAMVLFGDGSVRFLDDKEVMQFGGLNENVAAR
jgi:hypothetical protein